MSDIAELASEADVLDLFAGAGGSARGFVSLGYDVLGIDIDPRPQYPGPCLKMDLTESLPSEITDSDYRFAWASPPCQKYTSRGDGPHLIPRARELLTSVSADSWILENVPGAREHLDDPVILSGATDHRLIAGNAEIRKKRLFEVSWFGTTPPRRDVGRFDFALGSRERPAEGFRAAHGLGGSHIPVKDVRAAIPPAYVRFLVWQECQTEGRDYPGEGSA
jgi:DNA (cytosine-5)-methyltransferase 1